MKIFKKLAVLALLLSASVSTPAHAELDPDFAWALVILGLSSTSAILYDKHHDAQKAQNLVDQAYAGNGEQLEALAGAFGKSVEETSEAIVRLEKDGLISAEQPVEMVKTITEELNK